MRYVSLNGMVTIYQTDLGLSDAKFREIGRIIAYWSLLEFLMGAAVGILEGVDRKAGREMTLMRPVDVLINKLRTAATGRGLSKRLTERMNRLIARIECEHENRRSVAHGVWGIRDRKRSLLRYRKPDLVKLGHPRRLTTNDLRKIANRIETLTRDFERWLDALPGRA